MAARSKAFSLGTIPSSSNDLPYNVDQGQLACNAHLKINVEVVQS